jgi:hypothetical protein
MRILDQHISLKENLLISLRRHWLLWAVLLVTAMIDFATTLGFMYEYGIRVEKNLVVRFLALHLGIIPGVLVGKSLQIFAAAILTALSPKYARAILLLIVGVNVLAFLANFFLVPRLPAA